MTGIFCPKCGEPLELDPDGGWCPKCEEYWDSTDLMDEEDEEDEADRERQFMG